MSPLPSGRLFHSSESWFLVVACAAFVFVVGYIKLLLYRGERIMLICGECHDNRLCDHRYSFVTKDECERCRKWRNVIECISPFGETSSIDVSEKKDPKNPQQWSSVLYPAD